MITATDSSVQERAKEIMADASLGDLHQRQELVRKLWESFGAEKMLAVKAAMKAERVQTNATEAAAAKGPNLCSVCNEVIPPTGKRGRPAKTHAECKVG